MLMKDLDAAFEQSLQLGEKRIDALMTDVLRILKRGAPKGATGFLGIAQASAKSSGDEFAVTLRILPPQKLDAAIVSTMEDMERKRDLEERAAFAQACEEFEGLTSIVLKIVSEQVLAVMSRTAVGAISSTAIGATSLIATSASAGSSTAESAASDVQTNVRLSAASEKWRTVGDEALDMELRRDASEDVGRTHMLELAGRLLETENKMIHDKLVAVAEKLTEL